MKIILNRDVVGLGHRGDVKEVREGYFRNFLLPKKIAELATAEAIKDHEARAANKARSRELLEDEANKEIEKLEGFGVLIKEKMNEKGSLYKSVSREEISAKLNAKGFSFVRPEWIILENPIKARGKYEIEVQNHFGKKTKFSIEVR